MCENTGYLHENPPVTQNIFGGVSSVTDREVLVPDRNWEPYLPVFETQSFGWGDPMDCVIMSALNCLEIIGKRKFNFEENFSDRFTAKMSGTGKNGNSLFNVSKSIEKNDGLVRQSVYPNTANSWDDFYRAVAAMIIAEGKKIYSQYTIDSDYISNDTETFWEILKYAPIQTAGYAWNSPVNGIFQRTNKTANHAYVVVGGSYGKYWRAFDSYNIKAGDNGLKTLAWNYRFWTGLAYDITNLKPINTMKFQENSLLQLVDAPGGFYLFAAGKLYRDDLSKILASFMVRTKGVLTGKTDTITLNDLEGTKVYNLKNEEVSPT